MRRLAFAVLFGAAAVSAQAASYEIRSPRYNVAVDVAAVDTGGSRYDFQITDAVSGALLGAPKVTTSHGIGRGTVDSNPLTIEVEIGEHPDLFIHVMFERGGDVVYEMRGTWATATRHVLHTGNAFRVGGDVRAPVLINHVEPKYTEAALKARISGIVIIEAVIDHTGVVTDAVVLKPLPFGLDQSALDAVKQWTFRPGMLNGQPVDVIFNLTVNFHMQTPPPEQ